MIETPETRYTKTADGVHIAYQVLGDGPIDLVFIPGWVSHIEWAWEYPPFAAMLLRMASFARLIWFDKRGLGCSDRPERLPTLEDQVADLEAVMAAAGSKRAALFGDVDGSAPAMMFAATNPDAVIALITYGAAARYLHADDFPFGNRPEMVAHFVKRIERAWGSDLASDLELIAPTMLDDAYFRTWYAKYCRLAASPAAVIELLRVWTLHDMRAIVPAIQVPTLLLHRSSPISSQKHGEYLERHIKGARLVFPPGPDWLIYAGNTDAILDEVEEFLTGVRAVATSDRVLATVLFTDIVGSTERVADLGDRQWRDLLDAHDRAVDRQLERFRGTKVNTTGDGMLATFDGPARAIRCAQAVVDATRSMGIDVRAGVHTGEVERRGSDIGGIAVHIGARVAALAEPGEVLVSRTVTDLVAGSGIDFRARGEHTLKGVPGSWHLFAVAG